MVRQRGINPGDLREPIQKLMEPEQPHSDLVPVPNTGIYINPDKPVDPWDCERWDGSPYCGGNPWGGFVPTIDVTPVIDECNIGIQLQPQGFGIYFPEFQVVYRRPECRGEQPKNQNFDSKPFTSSTPQTFPTGYSDSEKITAVIAEESRTVSDFKLFKRGVYIDDLYYEDERTATASPMFQVQTNGRPPTSGLLASASTSGRVKEKMSEALRKRDGWPFPINHEGSSNGNVTLSHSSSPSGYFDRYRQWSDSVLVPGYSVLRSRTGRIHVVYGSFLALKLSYPTAEFYERKPSLPLNPNLDESIVGVEENWRRFRIIAIHRDPPQKPPKFPPPPPRPPKRKCCVSCCTPKENPNNDRLLRLILQKVTKLEKVTGDPISPVKTVFDGFDRIIKFLGIKEMPARFPKRLIYPNGKGQVELTNLLEILGYQVKQLDRAVGNLPRKIKVTDTNPAQAGNQSIEVEVHSLADMGAETLKYLIDTEGDGDATNNMLVRALYELGFIHQGVVQSSAMLDALVEWADFKQKYKKVKVPFAFDPYAGQKGKVGQGFDKQKNNAGKGATTEEEVEDLLPKLLQNTEVEIRILVNGEQKSVNDLLMDIKRDTAAAAAGVSEKASPERLEQLVAASQLVLKLQSAIARNDGRTALTAGYLKTKPKKKS